MSLLAVRELHKHYGAVVALRSANLTVEPGEVHALLGANGAGKSTLVKMLTGVIRPDGGSVAVEGHAVRLRSPAAAQRAGLAAVFQDPALAPDLTVRENMRLTGIGEEAVRGWLARMELPGIDFRALIADLPLPTLRMLDLARALARRPTLLLLDEITAALPSDLAERVFAVMRLWRDEGRAVLFISHRLAEVRAVCDRATVLRDGVDVGVLRISEGGEERIVDLMLGDTFTTEAQRHRDDTETINTEVPKARRHGGSTEFRENYGVSPGVVRQSEGITGESLASAIGSAPSVPLLEVRDLRLGDALKGVSFTLAPGQVLGIAALEGQGQDALFDVLSGRRRADGGEILLEGRRLRIARPFDAIRAGMVLVPADRLLALLPQRPVRENIALPLFNRPARWGPINGRRERERVDSAITRLQIDIRAQRQVRRLSGGNQQKVTIARWLAAGFRILLCFDPTRGIDVGTKRQIYALMRELAAQGVAVLLFTSELPEIPLVCDHVLVLYEGAIVRELPASEADEATLLRAAHGLTREELAASASG